MKGVDSRIVYFVCTNGVDDGKTMVCHRLLCLYSWGPIHRERERGRTHTHTQNVKYRPIAFICGFNTNVCGNTSMTSESLHYAFERISIANQSNSTDINGQTLTHTYIGHYDGKPLTEPPTLYTCLTHISCDERPETFAWNDECVCVWCCVLLPILHMPSYTRYRCIHLLKPLFAFINNLTSGSVGGCFDHESHSLSLSMPLSPSKHDYLAETMLISLYMLTHIEVNLRDARSQTITFYRYLITHAHSHLSCSIWLHHVKLKENICHLGVSFGKQNV